MYNGLMGLDPMIQPPAKMYTCLGETTPQDIVTTPWYNNRSFGSAAKTTGVTPSVYNGSSSTKAVEQHPLGRAGEYHRA